MSFELTGVLERLSDTQVKSDKLSIREFVMKTSREFNGKNYDELIAFQAKNKACSSLDGKRIGETLKIKFDIQGRDWQGRVFNNLNAFNVFSEGGASEPQEESDLPF
jgi:hypothetical protein